jgi:predicted transcriptional regulator of viral defense system
MVQDNTTTHRATTAQRIALLARMGEQVFHADDLARLWHIQHANTLHTTLRRYVQHGILHRVYKGFFSLAVPSTIHPWLLGVKALHGVGYVSTESVLVAEGLMQQHLSVVTLVGGCSRRFSLQGHAYRVRQLADTYLYNTHGIETLDNGVRRANRARALADMYYFNSHVYIDAHAHIDWHAVRDMQRTLGYPVTIPSPQL